MMIECAAWLSSFLVRKRRAQQISAAPVFSVFGNVRRLDGKMGDFWMTKRIVSLLLALVLLLGLVPGALASGLEEAQADEIVQTEEAAQPEESAQPDEDMEPEEDAAFQAASDEETEIDPGMGVDPEGQPKGDGSEETPFEISSAPELAWFAQLISDTTQDAQTACAVLMQDIDLQKEPWEPMGAYSYGYKGTFDGQGHTIRGLNVSGAEYAGLFACVDGGTVKNLIVKGTVSGTRDAGGIAGYLKNGAVISACGNEAEISTTGDHAGGIAGCAGPNDGKNTIEQCYNKASVQSSQQYAGGILGYDNGKASITDCYNIASITGGKYAGGIRGVLGTLRGEITNCYNIGTVSADTTGAIAPESKYGSYSGDNCYALKNGKLVADKTGEEVTKAALLTALNAEGDIWKQVFTENGGYPVLSWQSVREPSGELSLAENVAFEREIVDTIDGEQTSLPTANLSWDAVTGAEGYVIALWQKARVWKSLTAEEEEALTKDPDPEDKVDSWSHRLLQLDQNAIISAFTDEQKQELLALQNAMNEKFELYKQALETKLNAAEGKDYDAANEAYTKALEAYEASYQACCKYIILQAAQNGLALGDYWGELRRAATIELGAQTSFDCTENFTELDDGVYYATVSAILDGDFALPTVEDVGRGVDGWQDPYTRMKAVTDLSWDGTVASWTGKSYFTENQAYQINLYEVENGEYQFFKTFQVDGNVTQADFRNTFAAQRSYAFTVTALADSELVTKYGVSDSFVSQMSPVYKPAGAPGEKDWVDIKTAEQWMEIANTKDEREDPSDPNSKNLREIAWSKNYRLVNNIDFSSLSAKDQNRTKSIGDVTYRFEGEFDGNGFEITGLTLSNYDAGLFWYTGSQAYIHDVTIVKPNVQFSDNAAVLALNHYGIIEDCKVISCNINADIGGVMGGLVGRNYGVIRESYVLGGRFDSHSKTSTGHGGFVGANEEGGIIERCWTSMKVNTESDYAGGFVGLCYGGTIRDCFALGDVNARSYSGGFVGRSVYDGNVYENCYAAGVVKCTDGENHGFIGGNKPDSSFQYDQSEGITNCYYNQASEKATENFDATGKKLSEMKTDAFRKLLGKNWEQHKSLNNGLPYLSGVSVPTEPEKEKITVTIELVKYNKQAYRYERFGKQIKVTMLTEGNTRVIDLMDEAVKQKKLTYGYEVTNFGRYISTINKREVLAPDGWMFTINGELSNVSASLATVVDCDTVMWYEGTTQNRFRAPEEGELDGASGFWTTIKTAEDLLELCNLNTQEALAGHYKLGANIDLDGADFGGIGSQSMPFTGVFDGNGKTISNFTIEKAGEENVGFFRVICGGEVKNLTLQNVSVTGKKNVGAVAGCTQVVLNTQSMSGSVAGLLGNVHVVDGTVSGEDQTGGLVGLNGGASDQDTDFSVANAVDNCTFEGTVTGQKVTGGLIGCNDGTMTSSSASGSVDAGENGMIAGGAIGENDGDAYDSFADVNVSGYGTVGGFVGSSMGSVKRCYALGDVYGADYVGGFAGRISAVDTAVSAGKVTSSGTGSQGYTGGFAGHLGGNIVGSAGQITVKNIYGYCAMQDGKLLPAAGNTDYSEITDGLQEKLDEMVLAGPVAVKETLKALFGINFTRFDEELKAKQQAAALVVKQIKALPAENKLKVTDATAVRKAKEAYDALEDDTKLLVDNAEKLEVCFQKILVLEEQYKKDLAEVARFETLMLEVPETSEVWQKDGPAIDAARESYNQIDKSLQSMVKELYKQLTAAEKTYQKNVTAGEKVEDLFDKIKVASVNELNLDHRKTVEAAQKAFDKLGTADKKSFVDPDIRGDIESYSARMKILVDNQKLIQTAEKAVKAVPKADKIKFSDLAKLQKADAAVQAVKQQEEKLHEQPELQEIKLNITGEADYRASKEAYDAHVQTADNYIRDYLGKLPAVAEDVKLMDEEKITDARDFYKNSLSKIEQGFVDKKELDKLTACEKQLKKVQAQDKKDRAAAEKVVKQIFKLPDVANGKEVTKKHASAIKSARKAYDALKTDAAIAYVQSISQETYGQDALTYLEACEAALKALDQK